MKDLLVLRPIKRILNNPSLVALIFFGLTLYLGFYFVGRWLYPVILSVVLAYLMDGLIKKLQKLKLRRLFALNIVFFIFFIALIYSLFTLFPKLISQSKAIITSLPTYIDLLKDQLLILQLRFPQYIDQNLVNQVVESANQNIAEMGTNLFSVKFFNSILNVVTIAVYAILVPILIYFMLKDKEEILNWLKQFLPENRAIIFDIWKEVDLQIANYIRGKCAEILVIWAMCYLPFTLFKLDYALLLSFLVGLSVLIPYIGAFLITFPVLFVAYIQFGINGNFWWISIIYFIIQILDGNVIVPIIFSRAVSINPVAVIIAVLVFGGMFGFWGVFFAIPLATVVKAVITSWHKYQIEEVKGER